jgi:EAL domain-containing protein (putative c-di-GMP-specific phosphodiesterase class I)
MQFKYTVQKIYNLKYPNKKPFGELLFRGDEYPATMEAWRKWYQIAPEILKTEIKKDEYKRVSFNLDTLHVLDKEIMKNIAIMYNWPVMIEWTETNCQNFNRETVRKAALKLQLIRGLKRIPLILDDMGSGEDGFGRMCYLRPDQIKIDGELFQETKKNKWTEKYVRKHIELYESMGIQTTIEWIETKEDLEMAKDFGATWGQGFYFQSDM